MSMVTASAAHRRDLSLFRPASKSPRLVTEAPCDVLRFSHLYQALHARHKKKLPVECHTHVSECEVPARKLRALLIVMVVMTARAGAGLPHSGLASAGLAAWPLPLDIEDWSELSPPENLSPRQGLEAIHSVIRAKGNMMES